MEKGRLSRRDFVLGSAAIGAGALLAACAPKATPTEAPAEEPSEAPTVAPVAPVEEKAVVTFWIEAPAEERRQVINELFVDSFNAAHPNAELEITYTEDLNNVLRTAMQAGAGPDIVSTPGAGFILEYVIAGHVVSLDDLAQQYGWKDKLLPWAYQSGVVEDHLYSLPLTFESMIVFYSKTLFETKGWEIPTNRAELDAIIEASVADDIYPFVYNNSGWKPATEHLIGMFYDHYAGADNVYKALIGEKKWTDDEFVGAMELMNDWMQNGYYSGSIDNYHALTGEDTWSMLANGEGAMMMTGTWSFQTVEEYFGESGQEWDWFPMPPLREGLRSVYALATGQTESINAKSEHLAEAGAALDWLYADKGRALNIASSFNFGEWMVPLRYAADDFPSGTDARVVRFFVDFAEVTGRGDYGYTTWTFWPAKTEVYLWEAFDTVMAGEMTPAEFQAEIQELFEEETLEGKVPPIPERNV